MKPQENLDLQDRLEEMMELPAYGLPKEEKRKLYAEMLLSCTQYHGEKCPEYGRYLRAIGFGEKEGAAAEELFSGAAADGGASEGSSAEVSAVKGSAAERSAAEGSAAERAAAERAAAEGSAAEGLTAKGSAAERAFAGASARPPVTEEEIPFLPVSIFKELDLQSIPQEEVFKVITSSGTTGQRPSRIVLDTRTSAAQQRVLAKIVAEDIGGQRLPCLILDTKSVLRDRTQFSARGAGILGFSMFASRICYALDENMQLNLEEVQEFIEKHRQKAQEKGQPPKFLLYGFTFMIWQYFVRALEEAGIRLDLAGSVLIHGGGWKKLQAEAVSAEEFAARIRAVTGIETVRSYYGMAEQTGCICMECACGHLHVSTWSDIIVRREKDYGVCEAGESGILQVLTPIAMSYPGHSLLTEDRGVLLGEDDCPCGRKGKYFQVLGRLPKAEVRGCSDTFEK